MPDGSAKDVVGPRPAPACAARAQLGKANRTRLFLRATVHPEIEFSSPLLEPGPEDGFRPAHSATTQEGGLLRPGGAQRVQLPPPFGSTPLGVHGASRWSSATNEGGGPVSKRSTSASRTALVDGRQRGLTFPTSPSKRSALGRRRTGAGTFFFMPKPIRVYPGLGPCIPT